ncbi:MAG: methionine--tRNA ligase [Candidatus Diapherotrites archaeon]
MFGHAYEKTVSDVQARWHKLKGEEVFFLTGTDEHGMKIQRAAEKEGKKPKEFVDEKTALFKELCKKWNISYDRFIRTTDKQHEKVCQEIFQKVLDKGDIYLGNYEGLYCTDCERFYLEKDLIGGLCPIHKKPAENVKEPSYFFKMGKYQKQLLDYFDKNPDFISPRSRRQEIINRVNEGLLDLSVSRATFDWGIPLSNDGKHVIYCWFDALLNYISGIDYGTKKFDKYWPADVHNIGKDILWFHSVIFPIMLFAAGIEPPKKVFVHGFINTETGEKMSKSLGNVIDPIALANEFGVDPVRYFLLREIPFGEDGFFSLSGLATRNNNELANELGNLLNRTIVLIEKNYKGKIPAGKTDSELQKKLDLKKIEKLLDKFELHTALGEIFVFISACNKYINDKEPWKLKGKELDNVLYGLADSLRIISILISPFIPNSSEEINKQLGVNTGLLKDCKFNLLKAGTKVKKGEVLFKKIEIKEEVGPKAREISVTVDPEMKNLDFKLVAAVIEGVKVKKKHMGLEKAKKDVVDNTDIHKIEKTDIVKGYLELYDAIGVKREEHAVKNLVEISKKGGKLPTINTVVDSYNLVSLDKLVIVGAHDLEKINGNIRIKIAKGDELYIPLGNDKPMKIQKGEYVFVDDKVVLCRLDVKQGEHTKVTPTTRNVFLYVQGNKYTSQEYIEKAMKEAIDNITKYCGGKAKSLNVK